MKFQDVKKNPRNFLQIIFPMLNLGGSQKPICFWPKKGTIQWQKRAQFNTNRKKKGHTAGSYGVQN